MRLRSNRPKLCSRANRFAKSTNGSASVEFVLWMPLFIAITMLVIDASVLFTTQANYWSVSRETARLVSRHAMTETEAEAFAAERASRLWTAPTADVTLTASDVTVTLSAPGRLVSIFNTFGFAGSFNIATSVTQRLEPT